MLRELHERKANNGTLLIRLLWEDSTDAISLELTDWNNQEATTIPVDPNEALEAFYHPFCYEGKD